MIPFIQKEAVDINQWITAKDFLDIVAMDTVTPGPIAINMATFIGYKVNGVLGAIVATIGVVLPSLILVTIIAATFYHFRTNKYVLAVLDGLKPAVIALITVAIYSLLQQKAIFDIKSLIIAVSVFCCVVFLKIHPMWMVIASGLAGLLLFVK